MPSLLSWEHDDGEEQRVYPGDAIDDPEGFGHGILNAIEGGDGVCEFNVDGEREIKKRTLVHLLAVTQRAPVAIVKPTGRPRQEKGGILNMLRPAGAAPREQVA